MDSPDIRIVLVAPSHPGNIGAVARAMKNMALSELWLVEPQEFPHPDASARASGAGDVLAAARGVTSLGEALAGCGLVGGAPPRGRGRGFPGGGVGGAGGGDRDGKRAGGGRGVDLG